MSICNAARAEHLRGALLGTAVGDALGLPFEGMSRRRVRRWLSDRPLAHSTFGGQVSDDTEHAVMIVRAFIASEDPDRFGAEFARELRCWLATLPPGVGWATLRGILRSCVLGPRRSGVYSAGNGPAMRASVLGVLARDDDHLRALTESSTRVTHSDPLAVEGALLIARAARGAPLATLCQSARDPRLAEPMRAVLQAYDMGTPAVAVADRMELSRGVTGYVAHTVPLALLCWSRHHAFVPAVREAITLGGDTDTVAAIVGGIAGARLGPDAIPADLACGVRGVSSAYLRALGSVAMGAPLPRWPFPLRVARNGATTLRLFVHLARRLLPPY